MRTPGSFATSVASRASAYETPVSPVPTDDGFAIALVYGSRTSWLRNVLASGHATLVTEGETWEVDRPELVPMDTVERWFTPGDVSSFRRMRVVDALRVHRVRAVPA